MYICINVYFVFIRETYAKRILKMVHTCSPLGKPNRFSLFNKTINVVEKIIADSALARHNRRILSGRRVHRIVSVIFISKCILCKINVYTIPNELMM